MAIYYGKIRLLVPSVADGKNATITSERGISRTVEMSAPITDVMLAGMEKYTVQAGTGQSSASIGFGEMQKIVTEDASALTVASPPTKTTYLIGENLDVSGAVINATIEKGDGTSETRNVTSQSTFTPPNGTQMNTQGTKRVDVAFSGVSSYFDVSVVLRSLLKKLPYDFYGGEAVVYNNEIHILGGSSPYGTNHYKWNGSSWTSVSTLPHAFRSGCAVVYNNQIHILGSTEYNTKHYKWNGSSWTSVSTLPYAFSSGCAVVYNNEIHILGSYTDSGNEKKHYKWNGSSWTYVSTLPYNFSSGSAVVYNNQIHILGGFSSFITPSQYHYKWNGSSWTSVSTLPYPFAVCPSVSWDSGTGDEIVILGAHGSSYRKYDAQWDGTTWTVGSD